MFFESWTDFWAMGGYGIFVWLSFGLTWLLIAGLIAFSAYQHRQFKLELKTRLAREQRVKRYQEQQQ